MSVTSISHIEERVLELSPSLRTEHGGQRTVLVPEDRRCLVSKAVKSNVFILVFTGGLSLGKTQLDTVLRQTLSETVKGPRGIATHLAS